MSTPRLNRAAKLLRRAAADRKFRDQPLCLVDVGASGGIADYWRQFEPDFIAFGFEPMMEECARLNAAAPSTSVRYFDLVLGSDDYAQVFPAAKRTAWSDDPLARTSAIRAQQILGISYGESVSVAGPQTMSGKRSTLDRFLADRAGQHVDFIKVDTDGHDYEVLRGARRSLGERRVLGLLVEVPFQGAAHPHAQLFGNIDRFLREQGYSLFDLEPYRYARAELPDAFAYDLPAQTHTGQVIAADALYLRDVCARGYAERWSFAPSPQELLKLACLQELFGMPDCAAEIFVRHREALAALLPVDECLDLLAPEGAYAPLQARFQADPRRFFASARRGRPWSPAQMKADLERLATARAELDAVLASSSWRLTAPLRALSRLLRRGEKAQPAPEQPAPETPARWDSPFETLREKWVEVPASRGGRRRTTELAGIADGELLPLWQASRAELTTGVQFSHRGWYHLLYRDFLRGKKVLDVGSGLGIDSVTFAQYGAKLTFLDLAESNLAVVRRVCSQLGLTEVRFVLLRDLASLDALEPDYDVIMAMGSLHHAPQSIVKPEVDRLLQHLKVGGRWLQLAYPEARWIREGRRPFEEWGRSTDGENTPWAEWYDLPKLLALLAPASFEVVLCQEFDHGNFIWFDLLKTGSGAE